MAFGGAVCTAHAKSTVSHRRGPCAFGLYAHQAGQGPATRRPVPPRDLVKRNPPHRFVDRMSPYLDLAQQTSLPHILRQPVQTREAIARHPPLSNCPRPEALLAPAYRGVRISSVPRSELPANCTAALSKPKTDYAPLNSGRLAGPDVRIHQPQRDAGHDSALTKNPAPLNQADYHYYQRNDQQDVNQPAGGVRGCQSRSPQNQQNYTDCPNHLFAPWPCITARAGPKRRAELHGDCVPAGAAGRGVPLAQGAESALDPGSCCRSTAGSGGGCPISSDMQALGTSRATKLQVVQHPCAWGVRPRQHAGSTERLPLSKPDKTLDRFWDMPLRDLLKLLEAAPAGLTSAEAKQRLRLHGPNSLVGESRFAPLIAFLRFFANPLVLILLAASAISIVLGDPVGGSIIIAIVLLSVIVNFYTEFQARHAVEDIRKQVATTAAVLRDVHETELPTAELGPGDIVRLNAGDLVPADARLLDSKDLHVRESALTGESLPVDKAAVDLPAGQHGMADAANSVFLGTAVQTGIGTAVIVRTGKDTAFGQIAQRLAMRPPETEFARGIRHFGLMDRK